MKTCKLNHMFFLSILIIAGLGYSSFASEEKVKFYVATTGNDSNRGTVEQPFATLQAAQTAIRNAKTKGLKEPAEVIIRGGTYYLEETLELGPKDSGTQDAPITWRAYENERVILSGGKRITGKWKPDADGKTWHVDLPESKGWKRDVNSSETYQKKPSGPWNFRQLFVEETRATRARFPNKNEQNPFLYAEDGSMEHIKLGEGQAKSSWGTEPDAQINLVPNWRFFNQWNDVTRVDVKKSEIYFGPRERHAKVIPGNWFWIEGVKSELDQPGEWYLDPVKGQLFYMPEEGQDPNRLKFVAPYLNRIIYLKGDVEKGTHVEFVSFKGIEFRHTTFTLGQIEARVHTDGAVMFENALNCTVEDCHFENIGGYALWLHLDSRNNVFHRNTVLNSGGGGVLLTGARLSYMDDTKIFTPGEAAAKVAPYLTNITHNTVKHCGQIRYYGGGVHIDSRPASMAMYPGNHIAHNHFQDLSRNGIFSFRNQGGNVVEFNENSEDWNAPQLFTIVHELAHLWIAETGISNDVEPSLKNTGGYNPIELFCNEVAANALMPKEYIDSLDNKAFDNAKEVFKNAKIIGVSSFALLVRALNLNIISLSAYKHLKQIADIEYNEFLNREEAKKIKQKEKENPGGPNYFLLQLNRNSRLFTQTVLDAFRGGVIEPSIASSLLNVQVNKFPKLEAQMYR